MSDSNWMIYGATGYTGVLLAKEAVKRGHRPVLAGRNEEKLAALAQELGLAYVAFELKNEKSIIPHLEGINLVLHAAGPFSITAEPMRKACLAVGAHYLDITGEVGVFEDSFACDAEAKARGVVVMSGAGFDVIPSDCLAVHVAEQVPNAVELEIGVLMGGAGTGASAGTAKSALEIMKGGGLVRRGGKLQKSRLGEGIKRIHFAKKDRLSLPFPWGDLITAHHSTGIPNITTYLVLSLQMIQTLQRFGNIMPFFLRITPLRRFLQNRIDRKQKDGPKHIQETARTYIWARAADASGYEVEAWLETLEGYQFTAIAAIGAVEKVLASNLAGALSPAQVLGKDFVLEIEGTIRSDSLELQDAEA